MEGESGGGVVEYLARTLYRLVLRELSVAELLWWYTLLVSGADDSGALLRLVGARAGAGGSLVTRARCSAWALLQSPSAGLGTPWMGSSGPRRPEPLAPRHLRVLDARLDLAHQAVALVARAREDCSSSSHALRPPAEDAVHGAGGPPGGARANAERTKRNARERNTSTGTQMNRLSTG